MTSLRADRERLASPDETSFAFKSAAVWHSEGRRKFREAANASSLVAIAMLLGVSDSYVSKILRGEISPGAITIAKIAVGYGIAGEKWGLAPQYTEVVELEANARRAELSSKRAEAGRRGGKKSQANRAARNGDRPNTTQHALDDSIDPIENGQ